MPDSSTTHGDPWATTSTASSGTRHRRADASLGGSTSTEPANRTQAPSGTGNESGPLVGRIERSEWTEEDIQLALQVAEIVSLLVVAYVAYTE